MESSNDVSKIINHTALIENLLNQIITSYFSPRKGTVPLFWNVLLDSSIMALGSKIKVIMAISQDLKEKLNPTPIHKVISLRNAFAHHALDAHATLVVGRTSEEDKAQYMLQIVTQSGKVSMKSREAALEEFNDNYLLARESLIKLLDILERSHE